MKTLSFGAVLLLTALSFSCKHNENATPSEELAETAADSTTQSQAKSVIKDSNRKYVRTADIKFKVKNVAQSTYTIENSVNKFGGIVTYTNLQSNVNDKSETKISQDSTMQTIKYTVENSITLRVPNTKLDTMMNSLSKEIDYLDFRIIKADDVALKMMANELERNRISNHGKRLENGIDTKGKKLNDVVRAEDDLLAKREQRDTAQIENLSLEDQVNFSTVTLALYQEQSVRHEIVASDKDSKAYGHFGLQIIDGLKTGWYILEAVIAFAVQLWSLALLGIIGYIVYKKYLRKQRAIVT